MADPFLSEVRMMSFGFAPKGWAFCNGQLLPIAQNQALFSLLGTTYGGDGRVTFGLPDLRGRVPISMGPGYTLGQRGGEESHTLTINEMAQHNHLANATNSNGSQPLDSGAYLGAFNNGYSMSTTDITPLNPLTVGNAGGSQAHQNMQPFLTINFSIALQGIFPSQN
ncbi:phage tail protein [Bradyrhizobium pachyrhizi]|uniref:phage tail protein n=1 Tax=Bradyrhizobium TaxID=374 RepID=UPI000704F4EE|nr:MULTISPECIES: tail fiber protein [Bradyrhizobium]KRP85301.1 phage tail protein [Bradyrhizobium pachyrhizi]NLS73941.1 phage tail protein [Bradyrhizobium brasilense]